VRTVLANGAVVIAQQMSMTPAVTINATVRAGGLHEPAERTGLAYLLGRVLDRGTTTRGADVISEALDDRGVSLRVASSRHATIVTCTCLSEDFDDVLSLVLDVVRNAAFPESEVTKRKVESASAIRRDEENPAVRAVETLFEMLYGDRHPYGRRAKGSAASIETMTREDLVTFHRQRFVPSALSLAIVGDVEPPRATARAGEHLEGWSTTALDEPPVPAPPPALERRELHIDLPGKSQSDIAYGFTTITRLAPRHDAYYLMNNILGQFGLGGRLADNIRERQGMAYYAFSAFDPSVGAGPLIVRAGVDPENVTRAIAAIDHEIAAMGKEGPTGDELAQSQQYLIGSIPRNLETNAGIAAFLQSSEQFGLGLDYDRRLPDLIRAVTLDQVRSAAAEILHPDRAAVSVAGPK
jgi:zinc protease